MVAFIVMACCSGVWNEFAADGWSAGAEEAALGMAWLGCAIFSLACTHACPLARTHARMYARAQRRTVRSFNGRTDG